MESAQVFSEPPINLAPVIKRGNRFHLDEKVSWAASGNAKKIPDGEYTFAIRPHHVTPFKPASRTVAIDGIVEVAELSGSESIVHFEAYDRSWISQSQGVYPFATGEHARLHAQVDEGFYFDSGGRLIAS